MRCKIVALLLSTVLLTGCGGEKTTEVVFGDAGWDSMKFHNAVAMLVAQAGFGLKTREVSGSSAIIYNATIKGDVQVMMETWTDTLPTYAADVKGGARLTELALNYGDNAGGLYVPRYMIEGDAARNIAPLTPNLKTVEDLKDYSQIFSDPDDKTKGRLYGAINGWMIDDTLRKKFLYYGLDKFYNYIDPGSDAALAASIAGAYEQGTPIVAYYWEPSWLLSKYDLVLLADAPYDKDLYPDGKCAFPSMRVTVCVNNNFLKAAPQFCDFLRRYETSSKLTSQALEYLMSNGVSYEAAAIWFLKNNDKLLESWLPKETADKVRARLK